MDISSENAATSGMNIISSLFEDEKAQSPSPHSISFYPERDPFASSALSIRSNRTGRYTNVQIQSEGKNLIVSTGAEVNVTLVQPRRRFKNSRLVGE
jgi:hypothetical protein